MVKGQTNIDHGLESNNIVDLFDELKLLFFCGFYHSPEIAN